MASSNLLKPKTYNLKPRFGFTLIELIVVMGIVAILSSILVGYSRQSSRNLLLTSTEAKTLSLISRAKFLSIETFFEQLGQPLGAGRICAYGVHVDYDEGEIFIFQERSTTDDCTVTDKIYNPSGEDAKLTGELDVVKVDTNILTLAGSLDNVVFVPPDPDVFINGNDTTREAEIELGLVNDKTKFIVIVNDAGQVRAE